MASSYITIDGIRYEGEALPTSQIYLAARGIIDAGETEQLVIEGAAANGNASRTVILITPHTSVHQTIVQDPYDQFSSDIINGLPANVQEVAERYPRPRNTES